MADQQDDTPSRSDAETASMKAAAKALRELRAGDPKGVDSAEAARLASRLLKGGPKE